MFCPNCGTQIKDGARFCASCGTPVAGKEPQQSYQQPQYQQPAYQQPAYQQPQYQQPAYQEPAYQEPVYQEPQYPQARPAPRPKLWSAGRIILGLLGSVLLVGSVLFLPYLSVMGQDGTMIDLLPDLLLDDVPDPYLFLGLAGLGAAFAVANIGLGQILPGLAAVGLWVYELLEFMDHGADDYLSIGFYGILVGAILLVVGGIVTMVSKHNAKRLRY